MRSRLSTFGGHPVHVMTVPFAMAPFALLLVFDVLVRFGAEVSSFVTLATALFGLAGTLVAILTGLADLAAIPDESPAHSISALHFVGGLLIGGLYAAVAGLVYWAGAGPGEGAILGVNVAGSLSVGIQGWLGGELVTRHRIGVLEDDEGAEPVRLKELFAD